MDESKEKTRLIKDKDIGKKKMGRPFKKKLIPDTKERSILIQPDTTEWEVSKILAERKIKGKDHEFLVEWKSPLKDSTNSGSKSWEPEKNLNCPELVADYYDRLKLGKFNGKKRNVES